MDFVCIKVGASILPPSLKPMEDEEERKALKPVGDHTLAADLLLRLYGIHAIPSSIKPLDSLSLIHI